MSERDLISIIVPVFKVEKFLDRCVQSIVNQSYANLEIILIDDGSPDNCPFLCDTWAQKDQRVKVIHKKNGGLSDARNVGMQCAKGKFVSFIDSDDWIAPEMVERLYNSIQESGSDIAACAVMMVWEDGKASEMLTVCTNAVLNRVEAQKALLEESLLKHPVWYKLYRHNTIQDTFFEVGKYHEDVFWNYQVIDRANGVSLIDYVGYYYFQRYDSIMGGGYSIKRLDAIEAYSRWGQYIDKYYPQLSQMVHVTIWEKCIYHGQMSIKYLSPDMCNQAFLLLHDTVKKFGFCIGDIKSIKYIHRLWLILARISLRFTCKVKNFLRIGL